MDIQIRPCREDEFRVFLETCEAAFGHELRDDDYESLSRLLDVSRTLCALDDDAMVGTAGAFEFSVSVPGGELPAAGVATVGVLPSHRRRGILTRLMRRQLEDCRENQEPLAILWASEGAIYQRFGYGLAVTEGEIDVDTKWAAFRDEAPPRGLSRLIDAEDATKVLPPIYDRVRSITPGMFARSHDWWEHHRLLDAEHERRGGGPMFRAVWEDEGTAEAYALYRVFPGWEEGSPSGYLELLEVAATSSLATREIWRYVLGVDLVARVKAYFLPTDLALFHMLAEPRRLRFRVKDAIWLRVVDVIGALEGRAYATEDSIVVELRDAFCPWNEGRWRLETSHSGGTVRTTSEDADLALDAADLGAVYLGGTTFAELARAGRVKVLHDGAARRADLAFHSDVAPWCPEIF